MELQHKFGDERQGVLILYCYEVKSLIVLYQLERTIFLLDEEY